MKTSNLLPFYHPSSVILVDDSQRFLDSFTLLLAEQTAYRCFSSAKEALHFINDHNVQVPLDQRCFSFMGQQKQGGGTLRLDLALIEQEISNPNRFRDISVVIVDFDMPEMNGLELCKVIRNRRIKKILLTGVGDEKVAVQAFNEGLIDRFLTKSDPEIARRINQTIHELQHRYFSDISSMIQSTLILKSPDFINDPVFARHFLALLDKHNFIEYYYVEDPNGFLLVTHDGALARLIVLDEQQMDEQLFALRRFNLPAHISSQLRQRRALMWLWESLDDLDQDSAPDWTEWLHPATRLEGRRDWYCALVHNPPADIEYDEQQASYAAYLAELDASA